MTNSTIKLLIGLGLLASILVGIGEYLLHFLPDGPPGEISMLEHVPLFRASQGHFFAVFGAPLYFAGYYGLKEFFKVLLITRFISKLTKTIIKYWSGYLDLLLQPFR